MPHHAYVHNDYKPLHDTPHHKDFNVPYKETTLAPTCSCAARDPRPTGLLVYLILPVTFLMTLQNKSNVEKHAQNERKLLVYLFTHN